MALIYTISPTCDQVRVVGTGRITTDDCMGLIDRILSDTRCRADSTALIDLRQATYKITSWQDIISIATSLEAFQFLLKNNIAIVARQSTLFPAEIFSAHVRRVTNVGIKVFLDMKAAEMFCRRKSSEHAPAPTRKPLPAA